MITLTPNWTKTGTAVLSDSYDIPIIATEFEKGLNGFVIFVNVHYERELRVEFRSLTALQYFLSFDISGADAGKINYDGKVYFIKQSSMAENWGETGIHGNPSWIFNITLARE